MRRQLVPWSMPKIGVRIFGVLIVVPALMAGCDVPQSNHEELKVSGIGHNQFEKQLPTFDGALPGMEGIGSAKDPKAREELLKNVIRLIETAANTPGGENFAIAVDNLNQYFQGLDPAQYKMSAQARAFLLPLIKEKGVADLESHDFIKSDGRHVEDCLMYHKVAMRVAASEGDELKRVRVLFKWLVEQVQLVPAGALGLPGLPQAQARPYDVLLRGMATEEAGGWSERGWLFMSLCRQLGIDVGLVVYTPNGREPAVPIAWCCAALIADKAYLFDTRLGMEIPGPDGKGVATLEEAATIPIVLDRLNLPGQSQYPTTMADLAASKISILIDSSPGYFSSRMRLLQNELAGKNRMILFRDPAQQRDHFAQALSARLTEVVLWTLPLEVEYRLFHDAQFVTATLYPLQIFDAKFPLLSARLDQLRGELDQAKEKYVKFRKAEEVLLSDGKTQAPPDLRYALDMFATYFLALCHLEQGQPEKAEFMFKLALQDLPEPRPGSPSFELFRWGAETNMGRLCEARGDARGAIAYYCQPFPTGQRHANLMRARALVWRDPMARLPDPLPPAPPPKTFAPTPIVRKTQ